VLGSRRQRGDLAASTVHTTRYTVTASPVVNRRFSSSATVQRHSSRLLDAGDNCVIQLEELAQQRGGSVSGSASPTVTASDTAGRSSSGYLLIPSHPDWLYSTFHTGSDLSHT